MTLATGVSVALVLAYPLIDRVLEEDGLRPHEIGVWAAPLHIGIASAALTGTLREIGAERRRVCRQCGYPLRGLRYGTVCPECGTPHDCA